jgi:hypothetical protein
MIVMNFTELSLLLCYCSVVVFGLCGLIYCEFFSLLWCFVILNDSLVVSLILMRFGEIYWIHYGLTVTWDLNKVFP